MPFLATPTYHVWVAFRLLPSWPRRSPQSFHRSPRQRIAAAASSRGDKSSTSSEENEVKEKELVRETSYLKLWIQTIMFDFPPRQFQILPDSFQANTTSLSSASAADHLR